MKHADASNRAWAELHASMVVVPKRPTRTSITEFIRTEAAGGVVLVAAAIVALIWANSPWSASYRSLWDTGLSLGVAGHTIDLTLGGWVNEALMTIFFFVVGLEIKRELVEGELRTRRRAALPAIAAIGGMVLPALIYAAFNAGGDGAAGWGIPMATDIAIAVGIASLLGVRMVPSLKVFLLALAIVDDIGAIVVIAVFYSDNVEVRALLIALVILGVIVGVVVAGHRLATWFLPVFLVLGGALWLALFEAGIQPTLAGAILGLLAPITVVDRLESRIHPWSSLVVVPIFALANAGIPVGASALASAASSRIAWGVLVGLVIGKLVGVTFATWIAVRGKVGELASGVTWSGVVGIAALAGIGFTVSIFVTGLAFDDPARQDQAKVGILAASIVAGVLGAALLSADARRRARQHAQPDSRPGSNPAPA